MRREPRGVATLVAVFFWMKTVALYIATAIFGFLLSLVASLCVVRGFARPDDDSPALGMLWILLFVAASSLLVPVCLGFTAELVQDKVLVCRFNWMRGLLRVLLALPMAVAPAYAWWILLMRREDARPAHWFAKLILLSCLPAVSAYLALRIKRQSVRPSALVGGS
jgi:hypothetical protein